MNTKATALLATIACFALAASSDIGGGGGVAGGPVEKPGLVSGGIIVAKKPAKKKPSLVNGVIVAQTPTRKSGSIGGWIVVVKKTIRKKPSSVGRVAAARGLARWLLERARDAEWALDSETHRRIYDELWYCSEHRDEILAREYVAGNAKRLYVLARHAIDKSSRPVGPTAHFLLSKLSSKQMAKLEGEVQESRREFIEQALEYDEDMEWALEAVSHMLIYNELRGDFGRRGKILAKEGVARNAKRLYASAKYIIDESSGPVSFAAQFVLSKLSPRQMAKLAREVEPSCRAFIKQAVECDEDTDWASNSLVHERIYNELREDFERRDEILAREGVVGNGERLYVLARYIVNWAYEPATPATKFILSKLSPEQLSMLKERMREDRRQYIAKRSQEE